MRLWPWCASEDLFSLGREREGEGGGALFFLGDLDDAGLHGLEAVGHLRVVAGHHELLFARQHVDGLERVEHLGQARDDLHGLARLHVVVEVRGIRGEHHRAALRGHAHDLKPCRVPPHAVHAQAREHVAIAFDHPDALIIVQGDEPGEGRHVGRAAVGWRPRVRPGPERDLFLLDPELRARKEAMTGPLVVVEMGDEAERNVRRLEAGAFDHGGRCDVVAHLALLRFVAEEPRVHEHGLRPAQHEPDEVVEGELVVRRLTVEELALRRVPFRVLERVHLIHDDPPRSASLLDSCEEREGAPRAGHDSQPREPRALRAARSAWRTAISGEAARTMGTRRPCGCARRHVPRPMTGRPIFRAMAISDSAPYMPPTAITASHERTRTTLRAWSMPVTMGMVTQRLASRRRKPGRMPTTMPPGSAAPREAACMTPPRPPQRSTAPARATARPTHRARAAVRAEHVPSPTIPMWGATGLNAGRR